MPRPGKCPKCEKDCDFPPCKNCGKTDSMVWSQVKPDNLDGWFCQKCDVGWVHHECPSCGANIPARTFRTDAEFMAPVLAGIFGVLGLLYFLWKFGVFD